MVDPDTTTPTETKTCSVCGETKPAAQFKWTKQRCSGCVSIAKWRNRQAPEWQAARRARNISPAVKAAERQRYYLSEKRRKWILAYGETRRATAKRKRELKQFLLERFSARQTVHNAVASGRLIRPESCSRCGTTPGRTRNGRSRIHGHHHRGYAREFRLDVVWLCALCHAEAECEHAG